MCLMPTLHEYSATCIQDMYTEAHEKIREDPDGEKAEKKDRNAVEWRCHSSHFLCNSSPRQFAVRRILPMTKMVIP